MGWVMVIHAPRYQLSLVQWVVVSHGGWGQALWPMPMSCVSAHAQWVTSQYAWPEAVGVRYPVATLLSGTPTPIRHTTALSASALGYQFGAARG